MGYHRNFGCNTGCCDEQEALASVTRTGTVLNFADTSGKQTAIDLSEILPDPNRLVSAARSGTKLNFTDNKGNITTLDLADLIPSFDGVTDVAATTLGIRVTMSNGQTKDIDLSQIYTAPVAFNDVSRNGNTLTFTDTNGGHHSVELEAPPIAINSLSRSGNYLLFTDTNDDKHSIELEAPPVALRDVSRSGTTLTFTDTNGGQHTVELEAAPEVPVAYKGAMLNGSTLRFTDTTGATHDVDLSNLVPAGKADRFLSNVQYDPAAKKLTFTTSATGEADSTFEVNIADLLPVTVGDGLTGNGTASSPVKVNAAALKGSGIKVVDNKFTVDYDTTTMEMTEDGKLRAKQQPAQASGLDCAAIAALPKAAWKPETSILVNQDGECKRLVPNENIFTDVVVDLAASKQDVEIPKNQSETVNIVATVTNAGANPTGEVLVTLTKPQLGTYQLGTPTTNNIGETKTGELTWKIPAMASGKSLVITLPVTFSKTGSFSFGLQATSTIDTNKQNNTKTMTFTVTERIVNDGTHTNYVPTGADCPLIIATDLTHNQRLNVYTTGTGEDFNKFGKYINVFADGRGFAGKKIKLEGASTVVVSSAVVVYADRICARYIATESLLTDDNRDGSSVSSVSSVSTGSNGYSPSQGLIVAAGGFAHGKKWNDKGIESPKYLVDIGTFDPQTQIFTFRSDLQLPTRDTCFANAPYHCVIWCRPAGKDCKWQGIPIVLGLKDTINFPQRYEFTKVKGNVQDEFSTAIPAARLIDPNVVKAANFVGGTKPNDLMATDSPLSSSNNEVAAQHTVTVTSGQEAQFTIRATGSENNLPKYISTGKTRTSYDASTKTLTVTVAADATPTDSVYWDDLKIIVK